MELGLNLSFAVKRWTEPVQLAKMCKEDFGVKHIQFTWDLIDPWWPDKERNKLIKEYKDAFESEGLIIDATFGGIAGYIFSQLLSPTETQRDISLEFFKRSIDLTIEMGADVMGTPVGGMSFNDSRNPARRSELYSIMLDYVRKLASYGKEKGLKEIHIEATPLNTEFPHSPDVSVKMMQDLEGSDIPVKLLIDWGQDMLFINRCLKMRQIWSCGSRSANHTLVQYIFSRQTACLTDTGILQQRELLLLSL